MYALEYCEHLYSAQTPKKSDVQHHGIKGMHWDERRFQNLDGSLTPEGRIRYGVGMSREEMAEARAAEEARQRDIDYNRSKSIREMDDYELQNAVNRSRMEQQFESNMIQRSNNFLQSKVMEEKLNQEYDELMYQKSRVKAERFMQRTERLGQFIGNLAYNYGRIQDVKGKIEDVRAKKALADKNEWQAEQEHAKADKERWNYDKSRGEYERSLAERLASAKKDLSEAKADLDSGKSKKELKAEAKAAKKAGKMSDGDYDKTVEFWEKEAESARKSGDKVKEYNAMSMAADARARKATKEESSAIGTQGMRWGSRKYQNEDGSLTEAGKKAILKNKDHEYIRKEGDTYIYSDKTKSGWESTREQKKSGILSKVFGGKERKAEEKRNALKEQAKAEIREAAASRNGTDTKSNWSYFSQKAANDAKQKSAWDSVSRNAKSEEQAAIDRTKKSLGTSAAGQYGYLPVPSWGESRNSAGTIVSKAAAKRRKHIKHSEEE